ncbi:MAG: universal stress protein [Catenulispora sp.]|nr:universal stress protein [Catenulispora sp.]
MNAAQHGQERRPDDVDDPATGAVVVGVDETEQSLTAVEAAASEAVVRGRPLRVVHADPFAIPGYTVWRRPQAGSQQYVDQAVERARAAQPGLMVDGAVVRDSAVRALIEASHSAELVVIGDRGRGTAARAVLGTVAGGLALHSSCPVMIARTGGDPGGPIVLGVDGSVPADAAAGFAFAEAALRHCGIDAVHAWTHPVSSGPGDMLPPVFDPELVEAEEERLVAEALAGWCEKYPDVPVHRHLIRAHARHALIEASGQANMTVVGSHGHGFTLANRAHSLLDDITLGSVSQHLLHRTAGLLVVVPHLRRATP